MTFDDLCRAVQQVTGEVGHAMPYELIQQTLGDELVREAERQGARTRRRKKSRTPPASLSSRASDGLEEEMSCDTDPFWQVSEAAWKQLGELQKDSFAEAMEWLRQVQPARYKELTHHWLEYISSLWASREFTAFEKALDSWVGLHVQVVKTYQLVRVVDKG